MNDVLSGAIIAGYGVVGLYFLRFWRDTRDRLFGIFAISFWLLAVQRGLLIATRDLDERGAYVYLVRLAAFVLIVFAVADKNRKQAD